MEEESKNERIENLLALILLNSLKGVTPGEKALKLSLAGFSNVEIANFLQISTQSVANALFETRKRRGEKTSKRSKIK